MLYIKKSNSSSFVVERRIYVNDYQYYFLSQKMDICNKIYNTAVKHYNLILKKLYTDKWYQYSYNNYKKSKTKEDRNIWITEILVCMTSYGLNEYDIHKYVGYQKVHAFNKGIGINIVQKLGTSLFQSIKKAVFVNTDVHYRKKGTTNSFEDKTNKTGIIYNSNTGNIKVMGITINLKPIRKNDYYLQEAICNKVKYCRIVRKPFKNKYKYFLQLIMEGYSPNKITLGKGCCGLDEGVSTIAYYNNTKADFVVLADGVEKYDKLIYSLNLKYQRRLRLNNPQCYNNGIIIKGSKFKRTKGSNRALMELKNEYRKKSVFVKQEHNKLANSIIRNCDTIIKEPMNFKALQKRSKILKRQNKPSVIKNKTIFKYKKKKRFGKSINRRSPGLFNKIIETKILRYGGSIIDVNIHKYKASQYNHITENATKPLLSERIKIINNNKVQRDLYSSFLLCNALSEETINFKSCNLLFIDFLEKQEIVINKIKTYGDITKNFGIENF